MEASLATLEICEAHHARNVYACVRCVVASGNPRFQALCGGIRQHRRCVVATQGRRSCVLASGNPRNQALCGSNTRKQALCGGIRQHKKIKRTSVGASLATLKNLRSPSRAQRICMCALCGGIRQPKETKRGKEKRNKIGRVIECSLLNTPTMEGATQVPSTE